MSFFDLTPDEMERGIPFPDDQAAIDALFDQACQSVLRALTMGVAEDHPALFCSLVQDGAGNYHMLGSGAPDLLPPDIQIALLATAARGHVAQFRPVALLHMGHAWVVFGQSAATRADFAGEIREHPDRRDAVIVNISVAPDSLLLPRSRNYLATIRDEFAYLAPDQDEYQSSQDAGKISKRLLVSGKLPNLYWGILSGAIEASVSIHSVSAPPQALHPLPVASGASLN